MVDRKTGGQTQAVRRKTDAGLAWRQPRHSVRQVLCGDSHEQLSWRNRTNTYILMYEHVAWSRPWIVNNTTTYVYIYIYTWTGGRMDGRTDSRTGEQAWRGDSHAIAWRRVALGTATSNLYGRTKPVHTNISTQAQSGPKFQAS